MREGDAQDAMRIMLLALEERLRAESAGAATVERGDFPHGGGSSWEVRPANPRSLGVQWLEEGGEIVLQAGRHGRGGRWELARTPESVEFVEAVVRAVAAGRATETTAFARSRVEVVLADGTVARETGYYGCASILLLLPGWTRWGRTTRYEPYG